MNKMKIKLLKKYKEHQAGEVIEVESDVANQLIEKGTARRPTTRELTRNVLVKPRVLRKVLRK